MRRPHPPLIRTAFASLSVAHPITAAIGTAYESLGEGPVAVRSSATAEDLPELSFAGQQDTYLNIMGTEAVCRAVVDCWSSLWTARAITYRKRAGIPNDVVALAVVVQRLVPADVSGVLFTANPLTGHRGQMTIDATLGLGEALVSGQVDPDHVVADGATGRVLSRTVGSKAVATRALDDGGVATTASASDTVTLSDPQVRELVEAGAGWRASSGRRRTSSGLGTTASCGCCRRGRSPRSTRCRSRRRPTRCGCRSARYRGCSRR